MTDRKKLIDLLDDFPVQMEWHDNADLANYLLSNGVTIQNWIPVTERLPECNKRVLAYKKNRGGEWLFWAKFENKQWYDMEWNCWRYGITHWMPLPEPPKEANDED